MRVVMVMFDSLNRKFLPPYGAEGIHAPNFTRLAERSVVFDNCYGGSMPCMPARREMHTGRYNLLHRSWGPLEPFDDSVPEMLKKAGVYTHLVTDHQHYWEDGGATYHNRYNTYEFFRGQEGDAWKGHVRDPEIPESVRLMRHGLWRQDWINRGYLSDVADHPQTRVFDAGLEFMATNQAEDNWFLQIECFDPHEPFFSYAEHKKYYAATDDYQGPHFDWPDYKRVDETPEAVQHARNEYAALLTMCDASLGRVLDRFDSEGLWDNTMLMVCTDHGFLLGEHGWWGKNIQPWYDENIHTPLFIWDPRTRAKAERRDVLVQTIDLGPTLLDFFGVPLSPRMLGRPLNEATRANVPVRTAGLFGSFGGHLNVTDGRYVYMRASANADNAPLYEHTLMPTHMVQRFSVEELREATLVEPFSFTQGVSVLRMPGRTYGNPHAYGSLLFDLALDPEQQHVIEDDALELRMIDLMLALMRENDAPESQYQRLGLPQQGSADASHLLVRAQRQKGIDARAPLPLAQDFRSGWPSVNSPLNDLLANPATAAVLQPCMGALPAALLRLIGHESLIRVAAISPWLRGEVLQQIDTQLAALALEPDAASDGPDQPI